MKTKILLVAIMAFFSLSVQAQYEVGDYADDFELEDVTEKMVSLADYEYVKGFIVVFTCNHCPYSVAYEDRILELDAEFKSKGFPVIAINPNDPAAQPEDSFEKMKVRSVEKGFTFPYLFDDGQKVFPKYGATRTPHVFVLTKEAENKYKVAYIGAIDNNYKNSDDADKKYVADAVNALLDGKQPTETQTKAIGCTIKVAK